MREIISWTELNKQHKELLAGIDDDDELLDVKTEFEDVLFSKTSAERKEDAVYLNLGNWYTVPNNNVFHRSFPADLNAMSVASLYEFDDEDKAMER